MAFKNDCCEEIKNKLVNLINGEIIPWVKPWVVNSSGVVSHATGKDYSLRNRMILGFAGEYATFNQIKKAGGHVKKGEKAQHVYFTREVVKKDKDTDEIISVYRFLTTYAVFRVGEQTEGIEQKFKDLWDTMGEPSTENEAMQVVVDYCGRSGVKRESGGNHAFYSPAFDKIQVPGVKSYEIIEEYFSTMFHELVHSTGHPARLNRQINSSFGSSDYAKEELIAEIGSALCLGQLRLDPEKTIKNTAAYCQDWARKIKGMTAKELTSAIYEAERAKNYIFGIKKDVED